MTEKKLRALAFVALLCVLAVSCGRGGGESNRAALPESAPRRIISLSPSVTEMLHGVGAFGRVVAVSNFCEYPPEVASLPRVGGWNNPNMEQIASLRPDLVVYAAALEPFVKDKLEGLGIRTLGVPDQTVEDSFRAVEQIGRATGNDEQARELNARTRAEIEEVRARVRERPRRRVLCIVDRQPGTLRDLYAATRGSFIAELIEIGGGEPVGPTFKTGWGLVQKEAVASFDPDLIIDLMMQPEQGRLAEDTLAVWGELPQVRAVREGRVRVLRETTLIHPSQFVGRSARVLAETIHPEAFGKE